jgi:hypothetical protein
MLKRILLSLAIGERLSSMIRVELLELPLLSDGIRILLVQAVGI